MTPEATWLLAQMHDRTSTLLLDPTPPRETSEAIADADETLKVLQTHFPELCTRATGDALLALTSMIQTSLGQHVGVSSAPNGDIYLRTSDPGTAAIIKLSTALGLLGKRLADGAA